jgi:hypothetical protein
MATPHFSTLSHKGYAFRKKDVEHKICVFILSADLSVVCLMLGKIEWNIIINGHRSDNFVRF